MDELIGKAAEGQFKDIIEVCGEYFFVGDEKDWKYDEPLEFEEAEMEVNYILATRKVTGSGTNDFKQAPYILERNLTDKEFGKNIYNENHRWYVDKEPTPEQDSITYLPDNELGIYKEIIPSEAMPENIIMVNDNFSYCEDTDRYFCLRQGCSDCEFKGKCNIKIHKIKKDYRIASIDLKAQEPRCNVMNNPGEKIWREVFQNDSLRNDAVLLEYINMFFKEHLRVNIDMDIKYQEFLDDTFFLDHTKLLAFNVAIMRYKLNKTDENKKNAIAQMQNIEKLWRDYNDK